MSSPKNPYLTELARIQERVNALFEGALPPVELEDSPWQAPGTWSPVVDVVETDDAYLLFAELPGVRREDLDLEIRGRSLELSGVRRPFKDGSNFLCMERSFGSFRRTFSLDASLDKVGISARFERGLLEVSVPKLDREPELRVEIKSEESST